MIWSLPVVGGPAAIAIAVALAACTAAAVFLLGGIRGGARRILVAVALAAVAVAAAVFGLTVWPKPFPDVVPWFVYAGTGVAVFVALCAVLAWLPLRVLGPRRPWWANLVLTLIVAPAVLLGYLCVNLEYQQYPTVGSFKRTPVAVAMTLEQFQQSDQAPTLDGREVGALVTVPAPPMRDAIAYVPPAYWHGATLPVMVLLGGSPGYPMGWFTDGQADETADAYQVEHGGVSPIVVGVDGTGSTTGNPACVDGPQLQMQTYLGEDIPALLKDTFRVNPDQHSWTIGGLSYGGTCSLQVVANAPDAYGTFLDFSGEPEPSVGNHEKTVNELFGGDEEAFRAVNPASVLTRAVGTGRYADIAGRFVSGERDPMATKALPHLNFLARQAGMSTEYSTLPGAHSYQVWRAALRDNFAFAAKRGGLQ